jgi:hypothetical protein
MTAEPRGPINTDIPPGIVARRRIGAFLARHGATVLLGAAVLAFALHFIPQLTLALMDTETVSLPLFYQDVVTLHHPAAAWQWGGFSGLFPDVSVFFLLRFVSGNDWFALEGAMVFFFLAWLAGCAGLVRALRRPHALPLVAMLFLLIVAEACDFGLERDWGTDVQDAFFQPIYHSGTGVLCLACIALWIARISGGGLVSFYGLVLLAFLGVISDYLLIVVFVIPAAAALVVLAIAFRRDWQRHAGLAVSLALVGGAGFFLAPYCFPAPLSTREYVFLNWNGARESVMTLWSEVTNSRHHFFAFLFILDLLTVLGGLGGFLFICFFPAGKKIPATALALMVFSSCAIACDYGAVILTGNYQGVQENRYFVVSLLLPLVALAFGLHAIINWRPWLEKLFASAIAVFIGACAFIPQPPSPDYLGTMDAIPFLRDVMKKNGITDGLISYWESNLYTFLSGGSVTLRSVTDDGVINHLFNSMSWYGQGRPPGDAPHFRLIVTPEDEMRTAFGPPDQVLSGPGQLVVWIYSDARSIRYDEAFGELFLSTNFIGDTRIWQVDAARLKTSVGQVAGTSLLATAGKSGEDFLTYGPYLELKPGQYRAVYHYQYLALPAPDRIPTYDLFVHTDGADDQSLDSAPLPGPNTRPQVFTDTFTVTRSKQTFEMRINFHGSGTLRVDSLGVTSLGP